MSLKLERLISIIYRLLNHEVISATELAEKYEVSPRTIYRDMEVISAAGIPVVSYQGANGGYGIMEAYKMEKSLLGSYDVGSSVTVLHSLSSVFKDDRVTETIHRLKTVDHTEQTPSLTMDIRGDRQRLRILKSAITDRVVVRFQYINAKNEKAERLVEPVTLLYRYDSWYLYGYCRTRRDYRQFKLSRIVDLVRLEEKITRVHNAPVQDFLPDSAREEENMTAVVVFSSDSLAKALDHFYGEEKVFQDDGTLTVKVKMAYPANTEWLFSIVLRFGEGAQIVAPPELREQFKNKIEQMRTLYSEL